MEEPHGAVYKVCYERVLELLLALRVEMSMYGTTVCRVIDFTHTVGKLWKV
jgi:hypothetical protein